jgi:hypothetical protein
LEIYNTFWERVGTVAGHLISEEGYFWGMENS